MTADKPEPAEEPLEESGAAEAPDAPGADSAEADVPVETEVVEPTAEEQLAERTRDLQRLQAEYINYKRRVDRDRILIKAQGEASVLRSLLTVLDDIGRAAEHGELEGGFKAVADSLQSAVKGHKLEAFGAKGDEFDPRLHEALFHAGESSEVDTTTVDTVVRTGYRIGDDVLRHAQVSVLDPADDKPVPSEAPAEREGAPATEGAAEVGEPVTETEPAQDDNQD